MGKDRILVGKHCMEKPEVILSLSSTYSLLTTDLAVEDSLCHYPSIINSISMSPEDILQFLSFHFDNKCLERIAFSESSLMFIAKERKIKVAVTDMVTQNICNELCIETINPHREKSSQSNSVGSKDYGIAG